MQDIIQRILNEALTEEEKMIASLMDDSGEKYYVFAWCAKDKIIRLGYGKERSFLSYIPEPEINKLDVSGRDFLDIIFPYKNLSEKEAYVLFRYEKNKMKILGYTSVSELGLDNIYVV